MVAAVRIGVIAFASAAMSCASATSTPTDPSTGPRPLVVLAYPHEPKRTGYAFDLCEKASCLDAGGEIYRLKLSSLEVLHGVFPARSLFVAAVDGFFSVSDEPPPRHLFVLQRWSDDQTKTQAIVAEAEPLLGRTVCTVFPIEAYLDGTFGLAANAAFMEATHCYTLEEISSMKCSACEGSESEESNAAQQGAAADRQGPRPDQPR